MDRWTEEQETQLRRMSAEGYTIRAMARALGVTPGAIISKRGRMGLRPPRGDAYAQAMRRAAKQRRLAMTD
jgi:hypothetical protein